MVALVQGSVDISYLPAPANPQTVSGRSVSPSVSGALTSNSMPSDPARYAGLRGTLILNGTSIVLTTVQYTMQNIISEIYAAVPAVTASINAQGRLKLSCATALTIAGDAAMLVALGLVAGTTQP